MGVETDIASALHERLRSYAETQSPPIEVAWPNLTFTGIGPYLRPTQLPAPTEAMALSPDGPNDHKGTYQVSVFWPSGAAKSGGDGAEGATDLASAIVNLFRRGTSMTSGSIRVWVDSPPSVAPAIQEPNWYQVPVSVPYRSFVSGL